MKMKTSTIIAAHIAIMAQVASAAVQITGITTTDNGTWHITESSALVDPALEVGEQYIAPKWDVTPFPDIYAANDGTVGWVVFDLGANYALDEIRLWNANMSHADLGLMGWYVKNLSIHVGGSGAVQPTVPIGGNYFTDPTWTTVWDGDLDQGPGGPTLPHLSLVDPQLILDATGNNDVRYVAIDLDSQYGGGPALLGHIQIDGDPVPEPSTIGLLGLGSMFLLRRKKR